MHAPSARQGLAPSSLSSSALSAHPAPNASEPQQGALPAQVAALVWRGDALGSSVSAVVSSGWAALDHELPGGGWPCRSLTEVLCAQFSVAEWRLVGPALRRIAAAGGQIVVVGPPLCPHLPGLEHLGLGERHLVWIQAGAPAERLWVTEQLIKSNAAGAVLAWLPQAGPAHIRRLQACALGCDAPVFLMRPESAGFEASAAPLRVQVACAADWELRLRVLKRRGPALEGLLALPSVPGGLDQVLTPRLRRVSQLLSSRQNNHVVGRPVAQYANEQRLAAH